MVERSAVFEIPAGRATLPPEGGYAGATLVDADLSGRDLSGVDFRGANLSRANLEGAVLIGADLNGALLHGARLGHADFTAADLTGAHLDAVTGDHVGFGGAELSGASFAESCLPGASFTGADLRKADLRGADLSRSRLSTANLEGCDATGCIFQDADLTDTKVRNAIFDRVDLRRSHLTGLRGYEHASWLGADIRDIAPLGVQRWKRFVSDQNYLDEFRRHSRVSELLYKLWWLTSDCGRSLKRWSFCTLLIVLVFGALYTTLPMSYGPNETWLSPYYFSVVTITTLGYGDVQPASLTAQVAAMVQVTIGYIMLGGLLSIFSNKMARRAD